MMESLATGTGRMSAGRFSGICLLGWLAFLSIDFLVHGALLASWYEDGGPGLLSREEAFRRIPLGYASFLLLVVVVVWLAWRLGLEDSRQGLELGLGLGVVLAAARGLALVSIATIEPWLILWWSVAEAAEIAVVGWVAGHALARERLKPTGVIVGVGALIAVILTIVVQNL